MPSWKIKEDVIARIREASKYVPLEQLALSPQCGFASTEEGNLVTDADQWSKLALVKEIAEEVWARLNSKTVQKAGNTETGRSHRRCLDKKNICADKIPLDARYGIKWDCLFSVSVRSNGNTSEWL